VAALCEGRNHRGESFVVMTKVENPWNYILSFFNTCPFDN
jgi:hypothetical protein